MKITAGTVGDLEAKSLIQEPTVSEKDFEKVLREAARDKNKKELQAACQELEAVFVNKVMKAMQATIQRSDLIKRGFATDVWESMLFEQYAQQISKTGTIGLAQMLYKQLSTNL